MSAQYPYVEQDSAPPPGGDDLPTYDDLAAQNGPNSRFGRWRGWIEKRAAERYNDVSSGERERRRNRGWDLDNGQEGVDDQLASATQASLNIQSRSLPPRPTAYLEQPPPLDYNPYQQNVPIIPPPNLPNSYAGPPPGLNTMNNLNLHVQTNNLAFQVLPSPPVRPESVALPFVSQKLKPTHLKLNNFGSRFLPHATAPIRSLLPLPSERLVLIGHDEGLSVLDMFPQEWNENGGITVKAPDEAQARVIWKGEGVYQMNILELDDTGEGSPQGVVLALVGPDPVTACTKDQEAIRTLRMYNLSSLISLAKWAVSHKGAKALDLRRPLNWQGQQSPSKRHRQSHSLAKGLRSLIDTPAATHESPVSSPSYQRLLSPSPNPQHSSRDPSPARSINGSNSNLNGSNPGRMKRTESVDSSWEVVDDLPLRWATDFVPLAPNGSRLAGVSVLSYALWSDERIDRRAGTSKGGRMLAVATKANIFLYETPRGERAFHFIKEFYTPLTPRSITFFKQSVYDSPKGSEGVSRYATHSRTESGGFRVRERRTSASSLPSAPSNATLSYDTQLSIFVIFDKKAGWIRIADSAVGEVELADDGSHSSPPSHHLSPGPRESLSPIRRSRISMDFGWHTARWILPVFCELPLPTAQPRHTPTQGVYIITRGKQSYIMPSPLPANLSSCPPLKVVSWKNVPGHVAPRVCNPAVMGLDMDDIPPYLQLVSMCEEGIEVQELPLSFLNAGKGKGKAVAPTSEVLWAEEDVGGATGHLCSGGHWDAFSDYNDSYGIGGFGSAPGFGLRYQAHLAGGLNRTLSTASDVSDVSFNSLRTEDIAMRLKHEEGIYGWCRKGVEDYRVFWIGGSLIQDPEEDEDEG